MPLRGGETTDKFLFIHAILRRYKNTSNKEILHINNLYTNVIMLGFVI